LSRRIPTDIQGNGAYKKKKKRKVFSKYKDKDYPAVKRANQISQKELRKTSFEKMLAMNIKCDSKS